MGLWSIEQNSPALMAELLEAAACDAAALALELQGQLSDQLSDQQAAIGQAAAGPPQPAAAQPSDGACLTAREVLKELSPRRQRKAESMLDKRRASRNGGHIKLSAHMKAEQEVHRGTVHRGQHPSPSHQHP